MRMRSPRSLLPLLLVSAATPSVAQKSAEVVAGAVDPAPPRPRSAVRDTNDPTGYYLTGQSLLRFSPDSASQALYWASRLNPEWAEPLHARAVAIVSASGRKRWIDEQLLWVPDGKPGPRQVALADSLERLAFAREPFRRFADDVALPIRFLFSGRRLPRDDLSAAIVAMSREQFDTAAARLARAIRKRPRDMTLRVVRTHALFHGAAYDSAAAELRRALEMVDSAEAAYLGSAATTRAALQYALGTVHVQRGDTLAAREAFESVLTADLTFPMARVRRAGLTLAGGDTAAALADLKQEVEVRSDDPVAHLMLARVLGAAGRYQEGSARLLQAIYLAPEYAAPYAEMARLYDLAGDVRGSVEWYEEFLRRATRADPLVPAVTARLERIRSLLQSR